MNRAQQARFYQGREWRRASYACRERAGWLCERCKPLTVAAALAHHIKPVSEGGDKLDPANLEALCFDCHETIHGRVHPERREWTVFLQELRDTI